MSLNRPTQILGGLFIAAYSVLTMVCGIAMFLGPPNGFELSWLITGFVIEAGALWTFVKGADLLFGRDRPKGLIGPTAMKIIVCAYGLILIAALVMSFRSRSWQLNAGSLAALSLMIWAALTLARRRARGDTNHDVANEDDSIESASDRVRFDMLPAESPCLGDTSEMTRPGLPARTIWLTTILVGLVISVGARLIMQSRAANVASVTQNDYTVFMANAMKADAIEDPLQRCLESPDLPHAHWNRETTVAHCRMRTFKTLELADIEALLRDKKADAIDRAFASYLTAQESEEGPKGLIDIAFQNARLGKADARTRKIIDEWKRQAPASAFALTASGLQYVDAAHEARGGASGSRVTEGQWNRMREQIRLANTDLHRAVEIDPRVTSAYPPLIYASAMDGDGDAMEHNANLALDVDPSNLVIRSQLMNQSQPMWGSAFGGVENQRDESAALVSRNPLLRMVTQLPLVYKAFCDCNYPDAYTLQLVLEASDADLAPVQLTKLASVIYDSNRHLAIMLYTEALRFDPRNEEILRWRSEVMIDAGDSKGALDVMLTMARRFPADNQVARQLAVIYRQTGHIKEAEETFLAIVARDPYDVLALGFLGDLYNHQAHQPEKTAEVARRLIELHPDHPAGYIVRACYLMNANSPERYEAIHYVLNRFGDEPRWAGSAKELRAYLAKHPEPTSG